MFIGDFEKNAPWSDDTVRGCRKFLERVWKLQEKVVDSDQYTKELESSIHKTIKKVSHDYENLKANTAIAALMSLLNEFNEYDKLTKEDLSTYLLLLNPVAPHITEEMWQAIGLDGYLNRQEWPKYDESKTIDQTVEIPVQFNGKVRYTIQASKDASKEEVVEIAKSNENYANYVGDKKIVKEIYVPGKIYNIVIK